MIAWVSTAQEQITLMWSSDHQWPLLLKDTNSSFPSRFVYYWCQYWLLLVPCACTTHPSRLFSCGAVSKPLYSSAIGQIILTVIMKNILFFLNLIFYELFYYINEWMYNYDANKSHLNLHPSKDKVLADFVISQTVPGWLLALLDLSPTVMFMYMHIIFKLV